MTDIGFPPTAGQLLPKFTATHPFFRYSPFPTPTHSSFFLHCPSCAAATRRDSISTTSATGPSLCHCISCFLFGHFGKDLLTRLAYPLLTNLLLSLPLCQGTTPPLVYQPLRQCHVLGSAACARHPASALLFPTDEYVSPISLSIPSTAFATF